MALLDVISLVYSQTNTILGQKLLSKSVCILYFNKYATKQPYKSVAAIYTLPPTNLSY